MKPLIAIVTCHKFESRANAQRATWLQTCGYDYKFFLGKSDREPLPDEVFLDVPDDYNSLPFKVRAICKWAVEHGYDVLLKVDDDAYVFTERLIVPIALYAGRLNNSQPNKCPNGWCSGFTYWLTDYALEVIAKGPEPEETAEDLWVGIVLSNHGVKPVASPGFIVLSILPKEVWGHYEKQVVATCEFAGPAMLEFHDLFTNPLRKPELVESAKFAPTFGRRYAIKTLIPRR